MAENLSKRRNTSPERSYFDRFVNLERQREDLAVDIKALAGEATRDGIDVPVMRLAVKRHCEDNRKRRKRIAKEGAAAALLEALGEFVNTPLGDAALRVVESGAEIHDGDGARIL